MSWCVLSNSENKDMVVCQEQSMLLSNSIFLKCSYLAIVNIIGKEGNYAFYIIKENKDIWLNDEYWDSVLVTSIVLLH